MKYNDYSAFEHLCSVAFRGQKDGLVVIIEPLTVYCDATYNQPRKGSAASRLHGISALVATEANWKKSEKEWNKVLQEKGLQHFHMTEFENACKRLEYNQPLPESHMFYGWTLEELNKLFERLAKVVTRKTPKGENRLLSYSSFIFREDFVSALPIELKHDLRCKSDYILNVWVVVRLIALWATQRKYSGQILYIFATGDKEQGQTDPLFRYMVKNPDIRKDLFLHWQLPHCLDRTVGMRESAAIQMADVVAHKSLHSLVEAEALDWPDHIPMAESHPRLKMLAQNNMTLAGMRFHKDQLRKEFDDMLRLGIWTNAKKSKTRN